MPRPPLGTAATGRLLEVDHGSCVTARERADQRDQRDQRPATGESYGFGRAGTAEAGDRFEVIRCRQGLWGDPERELAGLVPLLSENGWLVVEALDLGAITPTAPEHPSSGCFERLLRASLGALEGLGADPLIGRRLEVLLRWLGLSQTASAISTRVVRGGSAEVERLRSVLEQAASGAGGRALAARRLLRHPLWDDATFAYLDAASCTVWGRAAATCRLG
ncbi:MAG: hypothetical protein ACKVWR_21760 [Acidimicrobiales bacterium]